MSAHTITVEQIQTALGANQGKLAAQVVVASAGHLQLAWVRRRRRYEVRQLGEVVHSGADAQEAVEAFNNAVA